PLELVGLLRVSHALVLREEAWQVRPRRPLGEHRDQRVITFLMGAVECNADLVPDPVHDAAAADIDSKSGGPGQCGLQRVLPAAARAEVGLVYPHFEAVGLCLLALLNASGEAQGSFAVDPRVGEE